MASYNALVPQINSIQVSPEIIAINQVFKLSISASDVSKTVYEVWPYSGQVYSGQQEVLMWP